MGREDKSMNVNPFLMRLEDVTGLPVVPDLYEGDSKSYITFTYEDERPIGLEMMKSKLTQHTCK